MRILADENYTMFTEEEGERGGLRSEQATTCWVVGILGHWV